VTEAEAFVLTIYPGLLPEGAHEGNLEYLTFVASDGDRTEKWSSVNTGTIESDLATFIPLSEARSTLSRLRAGEVVQLPGFWTLNQIRFKVGGAGNE
jgi:hypothetical protein